VNGPCALLFPGQGTPYPGMGADLYEASDVVRGCIDGCSRATGVDLPGAMFEPEGCALEDPGLAQLAVFSLSVSLAAHLESAGIRPVAVAGHSLGEYGALVTAGCLRMEEAVELVRLRGRAMARACRWRPGAMAAVIGLPASEVEELCELARRAGTVVVASYNSARQTVVSGEEAPLHLGAEHAEERGAAAVPLPVPGAFHSPLMSQAEEELAPALASASLGPGRCTLVSSVTGQAVASAEEYRPLLAGQITRPVRWTDTVSNLQALGVRAFIETGPGTILADLLGFQAPGVPVRSVGTWPAVCSLLAEVRP
jgi:[acyl-carrier-protein] S-malonyltransferase